MFEISPVIISFQIAFQCFIHNEFIPYIEMMEFFREFSKSLEDSNYESISSIPTTYKCYNNSLKNVIRPIYMKLSELEKNVQQQGETLFYHLFLCSKI